MPIYAATTEGEEGLTAATAETLIQLAGATTVRPKIVAWGISFDGTDPTAAPVVVELMRQTTAATGSGAVEVPLDPADPAAQVTARHTITAEGSAGDVIEAYEIHPQGGLVIREYAPGREVVMDDSATSCIAIRATAPAAVNAVAWIHWEE
jgi:hypothetical protein